MTSPVHQAIASALAGRYTLQRELGSGGMATVYVAQDLKHQRQVAIKVLRPELAAALGRERFLREVTTTANLRHPHILPLFDSGEAGEYLFYVMPLVKGESLRDRLEREKQLPLDDAMGIAREVADALDYAHSQGVVHRDIKPANILLENGHAIVADFGIARAISTSSPEALTVSGLSIGTPLYMSPEQGSGDTAVDGRSDQYALGCVLYEMLAGEPPFTGRTTQAILARQLAGSVPPLRTVRETVPVHVERAINRALSKAPADRFATTRLFAQALAEPGHLAASAGPGSKLKWAWVVGAVGVAAILLTIAPPLLRRAPSVQLDPGLMAVFPFRVSGTDTTHAVLGEGMVDFLESEFSGAGGLRVVPARTALAAWRRAIGTDGEDPAEDEAMVVARGLGAGAFVMGTLIATPGHLSVNGSLLDAQTGEVRAVAKVEGTPDSLLPLIDNFVAQLAALGAGERTERLASLTSASLPALYAYLAGKSAHRAGQYEAAVRHFLRALELDSTFALAAVGYGRAVGWTVSSPEEDARTLQIAWANRDRLGPREQVLLGAMVGPRYPEASYPLERLQAWEDAARRVPDDPDLWAYLGDAYFHLGVQAAVEEPFGRAKEAFSRALALDTVLNVEPLTHLLQIAGRERDTATVRRLIRRIPEGDPRGALLRLQAGVVLDDSAMIAAARPEFDSARNMMLLMRDAQLSGVTIKEAERSAARYLESSKPGPGQYWPVFNVYYFYQQLGRPAAASAALAHMGPEETLPLGASEFLLVSAVLGYADTAAATNALARLAPIAGRPVPRDPVAKREHAMATCLVAWWQLTHGDTRTAPEAVARLAGGQAFGCGFLLDALLAAAERRPEADAVVGRLDTLLLMGGGRSGWVMVVARWRENQGDLRGALQAARRCTAGLSLNLSHCLRERGRLAALVGDSADAVSAYREYLALRYNPEPSVKPEVDRVRAELARLVGEPK